MFFFKTWNLVAVVILGIIPHLCACLPTPGSWDFFFTSPNFKITAPRYTGVGIKHSSTIQLGNQRGCIGAMYYATPLKPRPYPEPLAMQGSSHNLDTLATLGVRKKALVVQKDYKEDVPLGADAGQASAHEEGIEEAVGHNEVQ